MNGRGGRALVVIALAAAIGCGSSGATPGGGGDGGDDGPAAVCKALLDDFMSALAVASACTPGAADQCALEIDLPTPCHCTVFINVATDTLARAATALAQSGCNGVCMSACTTARSGTCVSRIEGSYCRTN